MFDADKIIKKIKEKLVKVYKPIAIYICGPFAKGTVEEDDEIEIIVVIDEFKKDYTDTVADGHIILSNLEVGKEIKVTDKQTFEKETKDKNGYYFYVIKKGKKIYERL